jgi:hypothetical protein
LLISKSPENCYYGILLANKIKQHLCYWILRFLQIITLPKTWEKNIGETGLFKAGPEENREDFPSEIYLSEFQGAKTFYRRKREV